MDEILNEILLAIENKIVDNFAYSKEDRMRALNTIYNSYSKYAIHIALDD